MGETAMHDLPDQRKSLNPGCLVVQVPLTIAKLPHGLAFDGCVQRLPARYRGFRQSASTSA